MGLTFQVPMQYCSLQHQTLLSPPDISTTECCFLFGSASSFFLELLVIATCPQVHIEHLPPPGFIFWCHTFAFSYCSWGSPRKITRSSSSGTHFVRTLHHDLSILDSSEWHGLIVSLNYPSLFAMRRL